MIKFDVNGKVGAVTLTLPTKLNEISSQYLAGIGSEIAVADNYVLVALCYKERISSFISTSRQSKDGIKTSVVPLFVKAGRSENEFINNINTGAKLIASGSALSLGHHVVAKSNVLSIGAFLGNIEGDNNVYSNALKHPEDVYFVELKLIPAVDIVGYYTEDSAVETSEFAGAKR